MIKSPLTPRLQFGPPKRQRASAGMIPLIDIAFFLLIFFMVAGSIQQFEIIEIDPPQAQAGRMLDEGQLTILLGKYDEIVMDDLLLDMNELTQRLKAKLAVNPNRVVTVKADGAVPAVRLIAIIDQVKHAGGKEITIATDGGR